MQVFFRPQSLAVVWTLMAGFACQFAGVLHAASLNPLPGMPPVLDPHDIYAADRPGMLSPVVKNFPSRVYVPNSVSNTVSVIDPATYKVIETFPVGKEPQHVVPSWDLKSLWVAQDHQDQLTFIDPATGKHGRSVHVDDPYNMYFTPDGKYAMVMAEREKRIDFRDAHTMDVVNRVPVGCAGVNHVDFSTDGRYFIATCEFSGELIKVDVANQKVLAHLKISSEGSPKMAMPQDCKASPDGRTFYIADMESNGVHVIDGASFKETGFIRTGIGAHGLYTSRDSRYLYVSNRGTGPGPQNKGSVSLIDFSTNKVVQNWPIPGGASPDMGGVSADGKELWLSGRYHSEVYVIDTTSGKLKERIPVGKGPHGLCIYPQPGRYSLGHTGVFR